MLLSRLFLFRVLLLAGANFADARPVLQKRDIFSDIANFFVNLEMQVDMFLFQTIPNFFTEVGADINQYVIQPAEDFFLQAGNEIKFGLYDAEMFVADIGLAIEKDVIDEANSVANFATSVANNFVADVNNVVTDVSNEFNNVIGPALNTVGQEIGQGLATAGEDIYMGLEAAGTYIENHPEIIAEVFLTVALIGVSIIQPELIGADAALIGEIAAEAGGEVAGVVAETVAEGAVEAAVEEGATTVLEESSSVILNAAENVAEDTEEPIYNTIEEVMEEPIYNTIDEILQMSTGDAEAAGGQIDVGPLQTIDETTVEDLTTEVDMIDNYNTVNLPVAKRQASNVLTAATPSKIPAYPMYSQVIQSLRAAGKVVNSGTAPKLARRRQNKNKKTTSSSSSSPTLQTLIGPPAIAPVQAPSTTLTSSSAVSMSTPQTSNTPAAAPAKARPSPSSTTSSSTTLTSSSASGRAIIVQSTTSSSVSIATSSSTTTSSSAIATTSALAPPNKKLLHNLVRYHFLKKTNASKTYTKQLLAYQLKSHAMTLMSKNNSTNTMLVSQIPAALNNMNLTNVAYPPDPKAHRMAIAHQISTGKANAYNKNNLMVKIEMDKNIPVDKCLGLPKLNCFGNQIGQPYCLNKCASRWYNVMNITPLHY